MSGLCRPVPRRVLSGVALALGLMSCWWTPSPTLACGMTLPSFTLASDEHGGVPAGTRRLKLYIYGFSARSTLELGLSARGTDGNSASVPITSRAMSETVVELDLGAAAIEASALYTLTIALSPNGESPVPYVQEVQFHGVEAPVQPTDLGLLALVSRASGLLPLGGCFGGALEGEQAVFELTPTTEAAPWARLLEHQVWLDDQPLFQPEWPVFNLSATPNPTRIRAMAACDRTPRLPVLAFTQAVDVSVEPGRHRVQWRATLPDGTQLRTNTLDLDLRCDGATRADAGAASTDAGATASNTGDAGAPLPPTAAPEAGAEPSAGPIDGLEDTDDGCALGRARAASSWSGLALALSALLARRRRARA